MTKLRMILLVGLFLCGKAWGLDEFSAVKCGTNIPKALIGKQSGNGRVVVVEELHKNIGLKDLGGIEISDRLFMSSWSICGAEYQILVDTKREIIRDVLPFPSHSRTSPESDGDCRINGKEVPEAVIAILDNSAGYDARASSNAKKLLNAKAAWKIDEASQRFRPLAVQGLSCFMSGVITLDGGS